MWTNQILVAQMAGNIEILCRKVRFLWSRWLEILKSLAGKKRFLRFRLPEIMKFRTCIADINQRLEDFSHTVLIPFAWVSHTKTCGGRAGSYSFSHQSHSFRLPEVVPAEKNEYVDTTVCFGIVNRFARCEFLNTMDSHPGPRDSLQFPHTIRTPFA